DVDLVAIVERLRNVPKPQPQGMPFAEVVDSGRQAGDPDYRKPPATTRVQSDDDFDMRYGLKPATFGLRPQND
ncbi:MAG: ATPase, partial [Mesorhizobium sp.]